MKRTFAAFVVCALAVASARAQKITVQELQDKMASSSEQIHSLQIEYYQKMVSSLTPETKESSGKAYFKKPRELRIEQAEPESQTIVASGKSVYIYTPRFHQVLRDSWQAWSSNNFLFPGLSGFGQTLSKLKKEYVWEVQGSSEIQGVKMITLHLSKPAPAESEHIYLWIPEADFIPRKTELVMGTLKMTTEITRLESNAELNPQIFKFTPPKGAQVIEAPK